MAPYVLMMNHIPLYMSDSDIARVWKEFNGSIVKAVIFEPSAVDGYQKGTVWLDLYEYLPHPYYSPDNMISRHIECGNYKDSFLPGAEKTGNYIGFLTKCSQEPIPEGHRFSFVIARQLQDVVRKQATHIQKLEDQIANMEASIQRSNNIYMDNDQLLESKILEQENMIHKLEKRCKHMEQNQYEYMESRLQEYNIKYENHFDCMESRLQEYNIKQHKKYYDLMELRLQEYNIKYEKQYKSDHKTIMALSKWCSQPMWKRSNSFVLTTHNDSEEYTCEF
jgi:hypothetical protein